MPKLGAEEFYRGQYNPQTTLDLLDRQGQLSREQTRMMTDDMANSTREVGGIYGRAIADAPKNYYDSKNNAQKYRISENEEGRRQRTQSMSEEEHSWDKDAHTKRMEEWQKLHGVDPKTGKSLWQQQQELGLENTRTGINASKAQINASNAELAYKNKLIAKEEKQAQLNSLASNFRSAQAYGVPEEMIEQQAKASGFSDAEIRSAKLNAKMSAHDELIKTRLLSTDVQDLDQEALRLREEITKYNQVKDATARYRNANGGALFSTKAGIAEDDFLKATGLSPDELNTYGNTTGADMKQREQVIRDKLKDDLAKFEAAARSTNDPILLQTVRTLRAQAGLGGGGGGASGRASLDAPQRVQKPPTQVQQALGPSGRVTNINQSMQPATYGGNRSAYEP